MEDSSDDVREQTAWALGRIGTGARLMRSALPAATQNRISRHGTRMCGGRSIADRAAVPALIRALGDEQANVREQAAWALGKIADGRAVKALGDALQDEEADVREQAAWALGRVSR